jgi:dienelactone hydrolase
MRLVFPSVSAAGIAVAPMRARRRRAALLVAAILLVVLAWIAVPYVDAAALVMRAAGMTGTAGAVAEWRARAVTREDTAPLTTRHGPVPARLFRPAGASRRTVVLVPGVHRDGIDESRLVGLAEDLAGAGYTVLTVAPPDLRRFRITAANTDVIEDAARWAAAQPALAPDGRVGIIGISFSGGLSIVAAGREALRDHVAFVVSFGGHGDLPRVMRYLCSGNAPAQPDLSTARHYVIGADEVRIRPPHDYGVAVVLLGLADRVVPADQVAALRAGVDLFLRGSSLTIVDMAQAEQAFAEARAHAATLPEPSRTLMGYVNDRAVDKLGPVLMPAVDAVTNAAENTALSPDRATPPAAPVFLLHGADDNVIPSVETVLLAGYLHDRTPVHALLSGLISHAEVDRAPTASEVWRLVRFWRALMDA